MDICWKLMKFETTFIHFGIVNCPMYITFSGTPHPPPPSSSKRIVASFFLLLLVLNKKKYIQVHWYKQVGLLNRRLVSNLNVFLKYPYKTAKMVCESGILVASSWVRELHFAINSTAIQLQWSQYIGPSNVDDAISKLTRYRTMKLVSHIIHCHLKTNWKSINFV